MTWDFIDDYSGDRFVNFGDKVFDMDQLKLDQHYFTVSTDNPNINLTDIHLYTLNKECIEVSTCIHQIFV